MKDFKELNFTVVSSSKSNNINTSNSNNNSQLFIANPEPGIALNVFPVPPNIYLHPQFK